MTDLDGSVRRLLRGEAVPLSHVDVRVAEAESFVPITKLSVCYIACGVIINQQGEILMMQEAKKSCHGTWYLPAGRVEPGENLVNAVKREVQEETGLECQPTTLIMVEFGSGTWHRFVFTATVTGGKLKTTKEKDSESLQAQWMSLESIQSPNTELRAFDILKLIECCRTYQSLSVEDRLPDTLPAIKEHTIMVIRLVVLLKSCSRQSKYLVNTRGGAHFPTGMVSPRDRSCVFSCYRVLKDAFIKMGDPPSVCGLLSVEHCGIPAGEHDGFCYTLVVAYEDSEQKPIPPLQNPSYEWVSLDNEDLHKELDTRIEKQRLVKFVDLHSSW